MERSLKILAIVVLFAGIVFCQSGSGSTSIYQTLFTNSTQKNVVSINVKNIGQVGHQVIMQFSDAPAHTCPAILSTSFSTLQFSYDTVTWTSFGTPTDSAVGTTEHIQAFNGVGLYPYVRFSVGNVDNVNCIFSAFYTGSSVQNLVSSTINFDSIIYEKFRTSLGPLAFSPATVVGTVSKQSVQPLYQCDQDLTIGYPSTAFATGSYNIATLFGTSIGGNGLGICWINASMGGTSGSISIYTSTDIACGTSIAQYLTGRLTTNTLSFTMGGNLGTLVQIPPGVATRYVCLGVVGTGSSININVGFTTM